MNRKTILLSAAHLLVDFSCAVLYFGALRKSADWWMVLLLYNACAFAMQMPLGLLADVLNRNLPFAVCGAALLMAAYAVPTVPLAAAVLAGLGNGMFHVGAGLEVLNESGSRSGPLGIFVSPGAIGLYLGTAFGNVLYAVPGLMWGVMVLTAVLILYAGNRKQRFCSTNAPVEIDPAHTAWLPLTALFFVVVLRSALGATNAFSAPDIWPIVGVLCIAGGKAAGGVLVDRFGIKTVATVSLLLCLLLICVPWSAAHLAALFLFNMTMPLTLRNAADRLTHAKGFSFGLLTFALFIGFLPRLMQIPVPDNLLLYALTVIVSWALLLAAIREPKT